MIKPPYVTFEQSKWLKNKGFDYHKLFQDFADYYDYYDRNIQGRCHESDFSEDKFPDDKWIPVAEQHQVVEWLRVNHGIWVEVRHIKTFGINRFYIIIWKYGEEDYHTIHCGNGVKYEVWDTPQEAYSAAFDYIRLNNLI